MQSGRGEGRAQDGKRKVFLYYIKIFREEEAEIFFFKQQKKIPAGARVIYMPNRPGNPAGLLELAMNQNRGIVSRPLAG